MDDTQADQEVELKLVASPAALDRVAERWVGNGAAGRTSSRLESRYYDTPDRRLASRGVTLRVRRNGDRLVQTLKTAPEAGGAHFVRGELEAPVADWTPRLDAVSSPNVIEAMGLVLPEELELVFTAEFERHTALVAQPVPGDEPALIELALDNGRLTAGDLSEPVSEIELELKAGPVAGLYRLLGELRRLVPLRIGTEEKARRGYRLASGSRPEAVRAGKPALDPDMTVNDALGIVLGDCLGHWLANEAPTRDGSDVEGLHQLRVAVRRARSALALFRVAIGETVRTRWNERLKTVLSKTGAARDLDVFATETLPAITAALPEDAALAALAERTRSIRAGEQERTVEMLESRDYADMLLDFAEWAALAGWRDDAGERTAVLAAPVTDLARKLLAKRHKRVRKLGRHFATATPEQRHELRIALKKLRYGVEFLGSLFPGKSTKAYAKAASALQDVLGHLNDQAQTKAVLTRLGAARRATPMAERLLLARGVGIVQGWQASASRSLDAQAIAAWGEFADRPRFWEA